MMNDELRNTALSRYKTSKIKVKNSKKTCMFRIKMYLQYKLSTLGKN